MATDRSAYAVLGLRPGARAAEVDEAYRRLIKKYHPDRTGGDGRKAAEINRAYGELRRPLALSRRSPLRPPRDVVVHDLDSGPPIRRPIGRSWIAAVLILALAAIAVNEASPSLIQRPLAQAETELPGLSQPKTDAGSSSQGVVPLESFDQPLNDSIIDSSVGDAVRLYDVEKPEFVADYSRACHQAFRKRPNLPWFDACAAFDEAVVVLGREEAIAPSHPFSTSNVMSRHMGSARILSDDFLSVDSRLRQIRSRVEIGLIARDQQAMLTD